MDGSCADPETESSKDERFHPYGRQYSDGGITGSSLYSCLRESNLAGSISPANTEIVDLQEQNDWTSLSTTVQPSMFMVRVLKRISMILHFECHVQVGLDTEAGTV